jgi:Flp pilus assembly protein CpaB
VVQGASRRIDLSPLHAGGPRVSRHRRRALTLAALAIALAIAGLAELGRGTASTPRTRMVGQVVVLNAFPVGARLSADALGVVRVPARYASAGVVVDPVAAVGQRVAVALPAGAVLMEPELVRSARLAAGRDVAIRVDDAAGLPAGDLAGAHADVFLAEPGRGSAPTIVLTNVLVVAAGRSDGAAVATLRLPAAAVAAIIAAEGRGSLRLVMRTASGAP